jgi:uncharacterized protein YlxW (UPF0749 family)
MREDMENIATNEMPTTTTKRTETQQNFLKYSSNIGKIDTDLSTADSNNNIQSLQELVKNLQQKNKELQSKFDEFSIAKNQSIQINEKLTDNSIINSHVKGLNDAISKKERGFFFFLSFFFLFQYLFNE